MTSSLTPPDATGDRPVADLVELRSPTVDGSIVSGPERRSQALARVIPLLLDLGSTQEEIEKAMADDVLDLLVVDRMLVNNERRMTQGEVCVKAGIPLESARRIQRALGFSDVDEDDLTFTNMDVEILQLFQAIVTMGTADLDSTLQVVRIIGSSMARIAEATTSRGSSLVLEPSGDSVIDADAFSQVLGVSLPAMAKILDFVWRRHLQAATRRAMLIRARGAVVGMSPVMAIGFADMVGFTVLSQHIADKELAAVVMRFEQLAYDIVTSLGGRVVKMIGDEAMFVVPTASDAARIGLSLSAAYADDDLLSDVRVALAVGPVLIQDGDYYGPVVNLASRLVGIANPGTVLMSDEFHTAILQESQEEFTGQALRPRSLKGIGWVQVWKLLRVGSQPGADSRRNMRWERLGDVLRDIDQLRERGEKLLGDRNRHLEVESPDPGRGGLVEATRSSVEAKSGNPVTPELEPPVEGEQGSTP